MRNLLRLTLVMFVASMLLAGRASAEGVKQPIFLLSPHRTKFSAWSLYLTVDSNDPSKVLQLGLEKLVGKNSEDLAPSGYEAVLAAQADAKTTRESLSTLDAANFGSGQIKVEKDDALHVSLTPVDAGTYRLMVSLRIAADQRFTIGGKEQSKRDVLIKFDKASKKWSACASTMIDAEKNKIVENGCKPISGIVFPVKGTGIYRVVGVLEGEPVVLLDR
jgi:hypothetical protein